MADPQPAAAAPDLSAQDVLNILGNLGTQITALAAQVSALTVTVNQLATNATAPATSASASATRFIEKPEKFDGKGSDKARVFRNAFHVWAFSNLAIFGLRDANGILVPDKIDAAKMIKSVLSFLTGEAAEWARPHIETLVQNGIIFDNNWDKFLAAFQAKFEPMDQVLEARQKLKAVKQGTKTFANFLSDWDQWATQTGYSDTDLFVRMKEALNKDFLTRLSYYTPPPSDVATLTKYCKQIDVSVNDLKYSLAASGSSHTSSVPVTSTGFRDPNAMDIDASRFDEQFNGIPRDPDSIKAHLKKLLQNRCSVCANPDHRKESHPTDTRCTHCQKPGHWSKVCLSRLLGRPKKVVKIAASLGTSSSSAASTPSTDSEAVIAQLRDQLAIQAKQMNDLTSKLASGF